MIGPIIYNMNMLYCSTFTTWGHVTAVSWEHGYFTSGSFGDDL